MRARLLPSTRLSILTTRVPIESRCGNRLRRRRKRSAETVIHRHVASRWCMNRPRRKCSIIRASRSAREELSACPL